MKKCPGCELEIDKYGIACQYCGVLTELKKSSEENHESDSNHPPDANTYNIKEELGNGE